MKKKNGMKLEAINPVRNFSLRNSKPRGVSVSVSGQQTMISKRSKKKIPTDLKNYLGLCSCCSCSPVCTYPKEPGKPVLQCEEFDGILLPQIKIDTTPVKRVSRFSLHTKRLGRLKGLCAYCENLHTCIYPKPEGGVWHCEEYC